MPTLVGSKTRASPQIAKSAVSMPTLMPALAITTSGRPCCARQLGGRRRDAGGRARRPHSTATCAGPCPARGPGLISAPARHQRQPPARAVDSARPAPADAAGGAGDEDQRRAAHGARVSRGCAAPAAARAWSARSSSLAPGGVSSPCRRRGSLPSRAPPPPAGASARARC